LQAVRELRATDDECWAAQLLQGMQQNNFSRQSFSMQDFQLNYLLQGM